MRPLKLKKSDIAQHKNPGVLKKNSPKRIQKIILWVIIVVTFIGIILFTAIYSALIGGKALFHKGCFNFRYDLFPITLPQNHSEKMVFAVIGDTAVYKNRYLPNKQKTVTALKTACKNKKCDFAVLLGDNISNNGIKSPESPLMKKFHTDIFGDTDFPLLAVVGNHDYRTNVYAQIAYSYKDKNWMMPNNEFTVRTDLADLFGINSNCDIVSYMKLERRAFRKNKWNFVFSHHPIYSAGPHGDAPPHIRYYWSAFLADNVDFHVAGHNHLLEYTTADNEKTHYVVSGAGAEPNEIVKKFRPSTGDIKFQSLKNGFTLFTVMEKNVEIIMYDQNGTEMFKKIIKKS